MRCPIADAIGRLTGDAIGADVPAMTGYLLRAARN
jgi:hypothetical protein